jgi:hypothetical protein
MKISKSFIVGVLCMYAVSACKKSDPAPVDPAQTITSISPSSGPKNTLVTISGTNFGTNTTVLKVFFNGVQGTVQTATAATITATVPSGASTGIVMVEKSGVQVNGPVFTYLLSGTVTTFAGSSAGFTDGTGTSSQFTRPTGIVKDASGNFFVADRDNHRIRKITPAGVVTTLAGNGTTGFIDGTGTAARFNQPYSITIDASNNLYVGDRINHAIRKITPAGVVTTLAGDGTPGMVNGTGNGAKFNEPLGIAADAAGNIFVADYINNLIRKVTQAGVVTTFAGTTTGGFLDGTGTAAAFNNPFGLAFDAGGNLFVGDYHNHSIRKVTPAGVVTTIAGNGTSGATDGTGTAARFNLPAGLQVDGSGNIYVCDVQNHTIRKVTSAGVVTTFAGAAGISGNTDGIGNAALFFNPIGACGDFSQNTLYIADFENHRIRKIIID